MDWMNLFSAALTLVVSFFLKWFFAQIGVAVEESMFNAIVAGIVLWFLTLFTGNTARVGFMRARSYLISKG